MPSVYNGFFFDPKVDGMFRYFTTDFEESYSEFVKQLSCRSIYPINRLYLVPDSINQGDPSAVLRTALHAIFNQDSICISPKGLLPHYGTYFVLGESNCPERVYLILHLSIRVHVVAIGIIQLVPHIGAVT